MTREVLSSFCTLGVGTDAHKLLLRITNKYDCLDLLLVELPRNMW